MNSEPFIKMEDVCFTYEVPEDSADSFTLHFHGEALKHVSLEIERGSFVAVVGSNGSGKSTLAKNLNALLLPTSGRILIDGIDTKTDDPVQIRSRVGMVFQNPDNQLVASVIEDDIAFGPENLGVDPLEIRRRVDNALNRVSMYEHRKKGPHLLSGGQKQRIAIAGVIAMEPECIVFDEPTAMLDPSGRAEIMGIIKDIHNAGRTVILITHFMDEAAAADRIIVMKRAAVIADKTPAELFSKENEGLLADANLKLPFAVELADRLREKGFDIPSNIITMEALADFLCELK